MSEQDALQYAIEAAKKSNCKQSKRGVVIFDQRYGILSEGWNHLPNGYNCSGDENCKKKCGKLCIHAEMDSIMNLFHSKMRDEPVIKYSQYKSKFKIVSESDYKSNSSKIMEEFDNIILTNEEGKRTASISIPRDHRHVYGGSDLGDYYNLEILHVKINDKEEAVFSGPPSCWQCSRHILDLNQFKKIWLYHEDGLKSYSPKEFHDKTLETCNLL